MGLLDGHQAIVTGGGSGIGRATCLRMAAEGARVAVLDINAEAARAVATEVDGIAATADVSDARALAEAIEEAARAMGGLSLLFNNAGYSSIAPLHEWPLEMWDQLVRVNLSGAFYGMRAAAPIMMAGGGGAIVNTASISGTRPAAGEAPYSASKAGVIALTRSAALEYAPGIRVNAVSPGFISTNLTAPMMGVADVAETMVNRTPAGRVGHPEDIADVVVFLCSDLARYVTGQNIVIDGGMTLHGGAIDGVLDYVQAAARGESAEDVRGRLR